MATRLLKDKGQIFGRYTVLDVFQEDGRTFFLAKCTEGHERKVRSDSLKRNSHKCFECDRRNELYKSSEYNSWDSMLQRTRNTNSPSYYKYGGVGITCIDAWALPNGDGFKNFYDYMGPCPEGMTLDRWPDKYGNYEPGNVRWATNSEQGYNQKKRSTNTSGRTGVNWDKERDRWNATITFNNKTIHIGRFDSFEKATAAREEAELKYFGENKE